MEKKEAMKNSNIVEQLLTTICPNGYVTKYIRPTYIKMRFVEDSIMSDDFAKNLISSINAVCVHGVSIEPLLCDTNYTTYLIIDILWKYET